MFMVERPWAESGAWQVEGPSAGQKDQPWCCLRSLPEGLPFSRPLPPYGGQCGSGAEAALLVLLPLSSQNLVRATGNTGNQPSLAPRLKQSVRLAQLLPLLLSWPWETLIDSPTSKCW